MLVFMLVEWKAKNKFNSCTFSRKEFLSLYSVVIDTNPGMLTGTQQLQNISQKATCTCGS